MSLYICLFIAIIFVFSFPDCSSVVSDEQENQFRILSEKAFAYSEDKQYDLAIQTYKEALKFYPNQVQALGELCYCYIEKEQYLDLLETAQQGLLISQKHISKDNIGRFYGYIGGAYKALGQFKLAIKNYELAVINKPHFMPNYLSLAYCWYKLEDFDTAIDYYEKIQQMDSEYAEQIGADGAINELRDLKDSKYPDEKHSRLAFAYFQSNNIKLALAEYENALSINKNNILALYGKTDYMLKCEEWQTVISLAKKLEGLINKKENSRFEFLKKFVYMCLESAYRNLEDYDNSCHYARLFQQLHYIDEAKELMNNFNLNEALNTYKQGIFDDEDNRIVYKRIIVLAFMLQKYDLVSKYVDEGLAACSNYKNNNDELADFCWFKAKYFAENGDDEKAFKYCNEAINSANDISNKLKYTFNLAQLYNRKQDLDMELQCYKTCEEYISRGAKDEFDIPSLIIRMEETINENSDLRQFEKYFNRAIQFFFQVKNTIAAIKDLKIALRYLPQDIEALDLISRCYYNLKDYDETLKYAYEGYKVSLRDRDFHCMEMLCYNIANSYYNTGDNEKALDFYQKAHEQNPNDKDNLYFIGACYRNMKIYDKALEAFEKANKIDPEDEGIMQQIDLCKSMVK